MEVPRLGVELELQLLAYVRQSHSNVESEPCLWPIPQLTAMLESWPTEGGQGSNRHPHEYQSDSFTLHHNGNSQNYTFFFFFWLSLLCAEVPRQGIKPPPQQQWHCSENAGSSAARSPGNSPNWTLKACFPPWFWPARKELGREALICWPGNIHGSHWLPESCSLTLRVFSGTTKKAFKWAKW